MRSDVKRLPKRGKGKTLRILKRLMKNPAYPRELVKELQLNGRSVRYDLVLLLEHKLVKKLNDGRYAFVFYEEAEVNVRNSVNRLWNDVLRGLRPPDIDEIACEVGLRPQLVERFVYSTAKETGWFLPSPEILGEATIKIGEALALAARLRAKTNPKVSTMYSDEPEIVSMAQWYLKQHPELLPALTRDGVGVLSWPKKTLRFLKRSYQPKAIGVFV